MPTTTRVAFRIYGATSQAASVKERLPFAEATEGVVAVNSRISESAPLNDHLVWLWGMLKNERRMLKSLVQSGAKLRVECEVPKGEILLLPNAAEFLHLIGAELVVKPA